MGRGARRHFKMVFQKTLSGCLITWMILDQRVARIITTLGGRGHLTHRFSG